MKIHYIDRLLSSVILCVLCGSTILSNDIIATVGDARITSEMVAREAGRGAYDIRQPESAKEAVNEVITHELLAAEAKRLGYDQDPDVVGQMKQMMVQRLVKEEIDRKLLRTALDDEELQAYYVAHADEFRKPGLVKGQIIMILIDPEDPQSAENKVNEALELLKLGKPFVDVVRSHSDDISSRSTGGMTNWIIEDKMSKRYPQEVVDALFAAENKEKVHGPIRTKNAYYLVRLVEKRPSRVISFEDAKRGISARVYRERRQKLYQAYCEKLRERFSVKIDEDALNRMVEEAGKSEGPPTGPVSVRRVGEE